MFQSSSAWTIFITPVISSFHIINVVFPDPNIFSSIPASAADGVAVNPKGTKTLLANGLITCFVNGNPVFSNGPISLPRNPPDWIILEIWALGSFKSVESYY